MVLGDVKGTGGRPPALNKRAVGVARTRQRILGAVRQLLLRDGSDRLNVSQLIKVAGVARSTVHYQFDSRQGLLEEVLRDAVSAAQVDWLGPAREVPDPEEAVEAIVVQACRAWAADQVLFRRLMALSAIDQEAHRAVEVLEDERQRGIDQLVKRLSAEQQLRLECPPRRARTILSLATSFWTFDRLLEETLSRVETCGILVDMARSILSPGAWRRVGMIGGENSS